MTKLKNMHVQFLCANLVGFHWPSHSDHMYIVVYIQYAITSHLVAMLLASYIATPQPYIFPCTNNIATECYTKAH